jgi:hypothetical protein
VIKTLLFTVIVEGAVAVIYATRRRKPVVPIMLTSLCGNLITQSMLWIVLTLYFRHYLLALVLMEFIIWALESFLFCVIPANHLGLKESALLSLIMNGISLGLGWFLPV